MSGTERPTSRHAPPAGRDDELDMVKGGLVIAMMIAHAGNLFVEPGAVRFAIYPTALGWVSGSWIFIAGFLATAHYQAGFRRAAGPIAWRLWSRGLRLLVIFVAVNLALGKIPPATLGCLGGTAGAPCDPWRLLVLGNDGAATFEILQSIGYVLLLAPPLMVFPALSGAAIGIAIAGVAIAQARGLPVGGLGLMVLVGLSGMLAGWLAPGDRLRRWLTVPGRRWLALAAATAAWVAYQVVHARVDFAVMLVVPYIVGVVGVLLAGYVASGWIRWPPPVGHGMRLMARYALLSYMAQMAILHAWRYAVHDRPILGSYPVAVLAGLSALLLGLLCLDALRSRSGLADRVYRLVLG